MPIVSAIPQGVFAPAGLYVYHNLLPDVRLTVISWMCRHGGEDAEAKVPRLQAPG